MVVAYTLAVAAVIGLVLGLIPVANVLPANLTVVLREEGRSGTAGRARARCAASLVVAQVAFAFVLLVGAGLLFASFRQVLAVDPGFNAGRRADGDRSRCRARATEGRSAHRASRRGAACGCARCRASTSVGATDTIPFGGNHSDSVILAEGYQMQPGESVISPKSDRRDARLLRDDGREAGARAVLRRPRRAARVASAASVTRRLIIVDETLARRFWPTPDPIGRRMYMPTDINNVSRDHRQDGLLHRRRRHRDIKLHDLTDGQKSVGAYYFPPIRTRRAA